MPRDMREGQHLPSGVTQKDLNLVSSLRNTAMSNISEWEPAFQQTLKSKFYWFGQVAFKEDAMERRWLT